MLAIQIKVKCFPQYFSSGRELWESPFIHFFGKYLLNTVLVGFPGNRLQAETCVREGWLGNTLEDNPCKGLREKRTGWKDLNWDELATEVWANPAMSHEVGQANRLSFDISESSSQ